jgi:hypothetical protein
MKKFYNRPRRGLQMYESPRKGKNLEWKEFNPEMNYYEYDSEDDSNSETEIQVRRLVHKKIVPRG